MISHAITFPNKRADIDITFAHSLIISIIHKKKLRHHIPKSLIVLAVRRGQIFIKFQIYFFGEREKATIFAHITTNIPRAIVREKSLVGVRNRGISSVSDIVYRIDDRIGATEKKFEKNIIMKSVSTIDRRIFF